MDGIYVVVAENDKPVFVSKNKPRFIDHDGPLVFEQYTKSAGLESIRKRAKQLESKYGKCRIAKLVFIEDKSDEPSINS